MSSQRSLSGTTCIVSASPPDFVGLADRVVDTEVDLIRAYGCLMRFAWLRIDDRSKLKHLTEAIRRARRVSLGITVMGHYLAQTQTRQRHLGRRSSLRCTPSRSRNSTSASSKAAFGTPVAARRGLLFVCRIGEFVTTPMPALAKGRIRAAVNCCGYRFRTGLFLLPIFFV
jgi:hypothetical protein